MAWRPGDFSGQPKATSRRAPAEIDVDGVVAATFGLENGGRLPHAVPLREAVGLLVDAWEEAADWSRYEQEADPRGRGSGPQPCGAEIFSAAFRTDLAQSRTRRRVFAVA